MFLGNDVSLKETSDNTVPEPLVELPSSKYVMQLPSDISYGEESIPISIISCRRLFLAIFHSAFNDSIGPLGERKKRAIEWFKGERECPVSFLDVISIFQFNASRLKALNSYLEGTKYKGKRRRVRGKGC